MKSRLIAVKSYWAMLVSIVRFRIACLVMVFGVLSPWFTAMAATEEGLVVLPDRAPRFSGPQGREADITEILATREQTEGALGLLRQTIAPKSGPPTHIHRANDEFFYVVSGEFSSNSATAS